MRFGSLAFLMLLGVPATASAAQPDLTDPAGLAATLKTFGYAPGPVEDRDGSPGFLVKIADWSTAFAFGGCTKGKKCSYVVMVSRMTDVVAPPTEWINKVNRDADLGHVWLNADLQLAFSLPIPLGTDGVPLTTLRFAIDQWSGFIAYLANEATNAKLVK